MSRKYDVTVFGSAIVDVLAAVEDRFLLTHNIAKGVMTLIDEHRARELYGAFTGPREVAGGSCANTMAGLASLGAAGISPAASSATASARRSRPACARPA